MLQQLYVCFYVNSFYTGGPFLITSPGSPETHRLALSATVIECHFSNRSAFFPARAAPVNCKCYYREVNCLGETIAQRLTGQLHTLIERDS